VRSSTRQHLHPAKRGSADVLDHDTSEIAAGSKLGIGATRRLPGEGLKRPRPTPIRMNQEVQTRIRGLFKEPKQPLILNSPKPLQVQATHKANKSMDCLSGHCRFQF